MNKQKTCFLINEMKGEIMHLKKTTVLFLAIVMLFVTVLTCACDKTEDKEPITSNTEATENTKVVEETNEPEEVIIDPYGKYEEPITLSTVFISSSAVQEMIVELEGETIEDNRWTDVMKDELNIEIDYMAIVDASQYDEKVNILVASGQIPDYLYEISAKNTKQMIDGGLLMPVWDLFQEYGSDVNKALHNVNRHLNWTAFDFSGEKFAIPNVGVDDTLDNAKMLWIRRDWLKALDIAEPKTAEDLDAIIEAFTKDDPDQNGEADTYGLGLLGGDQFLDSALGYFNSNEAYPMIWIEDDSGKLVDGSNMPEVKSTLEKLQSMYSAGYLNTEFAIKGVQQISEDIANGKVGMFFGIHAIPLLYGFAAAITIDPDADWISLPIPGKASLMSPSSAIKGTIINKNCKYPEAVVKMMNVANMYDIMLRDSEKMDYYITDGHNFVSPVKYPHLPMVNLFSALTTKKKLELGDAFDKNDSAAIMNESIEDFYPDDAEILKEILGGNEFGDLIYDLVKPYIDEKTPDNYPWYTVFGPEGSEHVLSLYWNEFEDRLTNDKYLGPITETMSDFEPTKDKLRSETFIRIIMGEDDSSAFDKYIEDIKALGGNEVEQEVNDWYKDNK